LEGVGCSWQSQLALPLRFFLNLEGIWEEVRDQFAVAVYSVQFGLRHPEEGTTEGFQFAVAISFEVFLNPEGIREVGRDQFSVGSRSCHSL